MKRELTDETAIDYVKWIVTRMFGYGITMSDRFDDYVGEGLIGYTKAKNKYRSDLGASFRTYAERRIKGEIIDSFRAKFGRKGQKNIVVFNQETPENAFVVDDDFYFSESTTKDFLNSLNEKEKIVATRMIEGFNQAEIAKELNVTPAYISHIKNQIKEELSNQTNYKEVFAVERDARIRKDFADGMKHKRIAEKYDLHVNYIWRICDGEGIKRNVEPRKPRRLRSGNPKGRPRIEKVPRISKKKIRNDLIVSLFHSGKRIVEIAEENNFSYYTVVNVLRSKKLKRDKREKPIPFRARKEARNVEIYKKYCEGIKVKVLCSEYEVAPVSVYLIIRKMKKSKNL